MGDYWSLFFSIALGLLLFAVQKNTAQTLENRTYCQPGDISPHERENTTQRLADLRSRMDSLGLDAYFMMIDDGHASEFVAEYDKRLQFMTGFKGSFGLVVVTRTKAALWTDSRYYQLAERELDCNWILMKYGLQTTPFFTTWVNQEVSEGQKLGVDRTLIKSTYFTKWADSLQDMEGSKHVTFEPIQHSQNPVDAIWTSGRPEQPKGRITVMGLDYTGKSWQDKITEIRADMNKYSVEAFVSAELDDNAWLFNLRGKDIPYVPVFKSFVIIEETNIRLYILDYERRLGRNSLAEHLNTNLNGLCTANTSEMCVMVMEYNPDDVVHQLDAYTSKVWISSTINYGIHETIPEDRRLVKNSPISWRKMKKNEVERAGMTNAYNRDSVVLIKFLAFLEKKILAGKTWTEVSAAQELSRRRSQEPHSKGDSFKTISAYGTHSTEQHYSVDEESNAQISTDGMYLLDSGGHYLDGTTDVTRTMHYGTPTDFQKEIYTRVLMCNINLSALKWPAGLYGRQIDAVTRAALWEVGLDYGHGTGHGIGAYLHVHENPGYISMAETGQPFREPLEQFQYFAVEPGYYHGDEFGVRLENVLMVDAFQGPYETSGSYLQMTPVTLVPFESKLINQSLLESKHITWLNNYNTRIRNEILPLLSDDANAVAWVTARIGNIN